MQNKEAFNQEIENGYTFKGDSIVLGGAMLNGECQTGNLVRLPLRMMNRHGLIAGATGTGKTKTLQILAELLSEKGVPSLLMDVKGDLSGIAAAAEPNPRLNERHERIGTPFVSGSSPVDFLSLSDEPGARLRATVSEFGPVLFSKILDLNETQTGIIAVLFKYCDDQELPLLDLEDFKKVLLYVSNDGKEELESLYGRISSASVGAIMRKVVELEQQGAELFFGERSFDVEDLCRCDKDGKGIVSVIRLTDIQDRPKLFSTFMLQILAEIYTTFPEEGDVEKPKLVLFIDEAHLIFDQASRALLNQIEAIVKLIRSKGVGIIFVTQNPTDVPDAVLSQLGLKIQHALRAFTAKDRRAIKLAAENYPITTHYEVSELLTKLGIGEALVTSLNEKGIPTPLVHTMIRAPKSRMDILSDREINQIIDASDLVEKYKEVIDRKSAHELLSDKIKRAHEADQQAELRKQKEEAERQTTTTRSSSTRRTTTTRTRRAEKSVLEKAMNTPLVRQAANTFTREITRGLLGMLGIKKRR